MTPEEISVIREVLRSFEDIGIISLLLFAIWQHRETSKNQRRYYRGVVKALLVALVVALAPEQKIERMKEELDYDPDAE